MPVGKSKKQISKWERALEKHFFWWASAVAVIIIFLGVWFLLLPMYNEWRGGVNIDQERAELNVARARLVELKKISAEWGAVKKQVPARDLPFILPKEVNIPDLLVQLEAVASQTGFTLQGIAVSEATKGSGRKAETSGIQADGTRVVKITYSIDGVTYPKFKVLLQALEQAWRLIQVDSFTLGRDTSLSLDLTSYYFPE